MSSGVDKKACLRSDVNPVLKLDMYWQYNMANGLDQVCTLINLGHKVHSYCKKLWLHRLSQDHPLTGKEMLATNSNKDQSLHPTRKPHWKYC
jgi:hypothetical protein